MNQRIVMKENPNPNERPGRAGTRTYFSNHHMAYLSYYLPFFKSRFNRVRYPVCLGFSTYPRAFSIIDRANVPAFFRSSAFGLPLLRPPK